jgi:hypothetical protein
MRRNTKTTPIFRSKLTPGGGGPFILQDGVPMVGSVDGSNNLWVIIAATAGGGNVGQLTVQPDNADGQAVRVTNDDLLTQARLFGFNGTSFDRGRLASAANLAAFSGIGALLAAKPGNWAINHTPAAAAAATITRAAGAGTVRHVCTGIAFGFNAINVEAGTFLINLRDGGTGAGTILQSWRVGPFAAGASMIFGASDLNIIGSAAIAMTIEFAGAPAAGNFEFVNLTGYDAT